MERREFLFLENLVWFLEAKTVVEVGVQIGAMAEYLCRAANNNGGKYFGFDIWSTHGLLNQFNQAGSKNDVSNLLTSRGFENYTLVEIDTLNNREKFKEYLQELCPNGIDFAFIDGDHSYKGIANDFFAVYPHLNIDGVVAFHDTQSIDGCREFILDLRTKYNDGTFDISDFPFGVGTRRTGVTLLTKRSYPKLSIGIDEICGSISEPHIIEQKEVEWLKQETENKKPMPESFNDEILIKNVGLHNRKKFEKIE